MKTYYDETFCGLHSIEKNTRYVNCVFDTVVQNDLVDAIFIDCKFDLLQIYETILNCSFIGCNVLYGNLDDLEKIDRKSRDGLKRSKKFHVPNGDIIGYKKIYDKFLNRVICKLLIPAEARRSNAFSNKCRASFAKVLSGEGVSGWDDNFSYKKGKIVKPIEPFDPHWYHECASGIHFFMTKKEAEKY